MATVGMKAKKEQKAEMLTPHRAAMPRSSSTGSGALEIVVAELMLAVATAALALPLVAYAPSELRLIIMSAPHVPMSTMPMTAAAGRAKAQVSKWVSRGEDGWRAGW